MPFVESASFCDALFLLNRTEGFQKVNKSKKNRTFIEKT